MGKPSASEMNRIKAALKERGPLADSMMGLLRRRQPITPSRRLDEKSLRESLKQAGLDFDEIKKINHTLSLGQRNRLQAMEKRPARDEKAVAVALKALRQGLEQRRRRAEQSPTAGQPTRVYLDTPFMIQADKPNRLLGSNIEVFNSTASLLVDYHDEIPTDNNGTNDFLTFSFVWLNDSTQDAEVNTEALLVLQGEADCFAHPGLIPLVDQAISGTEWSAVLQILEMWNHPPTSPIPEQEQWVAPILWERCSYISKFPVNIFSGPRGDRQITDVPVQAYPLVRRSFLTVPRNGSLVFQVILDIASSLSGGGWCTSKFAGTLSNGQTGFVLCPYVELQVSTSGIVTN